METFELIIHELHLVQSLRSLNMVRYFEIFIKLRVNGMNSDHTSIKLRSYLFKNINGLSSVYTKTMIVLDNYKLLDVHLIQYNFS